MRLRHCLAPAVLGLLAAWACVERPSPTASDAPAAPVVAPVQLLNIAAAPGVAGPAATRTGAAVEPRCERTVLANVDAGPSRVQSPASVDGGARSDALAQVIQSLQRGDTRSRVAALVLAQPLAGDAAWAAELLGLAWNAHDALALRWAERACPLTADEAACRRQLQLGRLQLEPGNARHWLDWAQEAPAQSEAAWAGLMRASHWRDEPLALAALARQAMPDGVAAAAAEAAMAQVIALEGLPAAPSPDVLRQRCGEAGLSAGPRSQDCDAVARLLVEHSDSAAALKLGVALAKAADAPPERIEALERAAESLERRAVERSGAAARQACAAPQSSVLSAQSSGNSTTSSILRR